VPARSCTVRGVNGSLLQDGFAHHVWATLRVMDVCARLSPDQLGAMAPGTFGSILDTLRHIVAADSSYLFVLTGGRVQPVDEERMDLAELRSSMERFGDAWMDLLAEDLDQAALLVRHRDDGSSTTAPTGIRLAQVLHHGTDHRSQICTTLTTLGIEPPEIDVWDFGLADGRVVEAPPGS
jgi:uncharacterized damage-inducible protein DinB